MEGGPRPSARVGGNYGEAKGRLSPWKGGFPASSRASEVTMARRGTADGRDMVTLHARERLGSLPSMGYALGGRFGEVIYFE